MSHFEITHFEMLVIGLLLSAGLLLTGLITGSMPGSSGDHDRDKQPGLFWFNAALYIFITFGLLYLIAKELT